MAEYPALPLFTDAYMADTRHLTPAQHGAYLLLLMTAWRMPDCKLPNDDTFLCRCASMDRRVWDNNRDVIMSFWKQDDLQKWYQARLLDERKYVDDMRNKNSAAGKASALKRLNRGSTGVPTKPQRESNPHTPPIPLIPPLSPKDDSDFMACWTIFPSKRRGGLDEGYKAWLKAIKKESAGVITKAAMAYSKCDEVTKDDGKYAKGFSAWMNAERWNNDYGQNKAPSSGTMGYKNVAQLGGKRD